MCHFPHGSNNRATLAVVMAVSGMCLEPGAGATVQVPMTPPDGSRLLGLRTNLPARDAPLFGQPEATTAGLDFGIGVKSVYNSNFYLTAHHPDNELSTDILPWVSYCSDPEGGAPISFTASYQPNIVTYLNHPDLNGVDHSGSAAITLTGSKTVISAYLNYLTLSGTDRLSGSFTTGSGLDFGMSATYQIAPRTSVFANWKVSQVDYDAGALVGSDSYSVGLGGYWSATERFSFGPSIRYDRDESANTGTRDAWALSMQARYLMGAKLQFIGSLGLQTSQNSRDGGGWQFGPVGGLAANYAINERLAWHNSIQYTIVPSTSEMNYLMNNLTISTALTRQLLRASLSLGLELELADYEEAGPVATTLGSESNLSAVLGYHRKLFSDRLDFDTSIRYTLNQGRTDWSQLELTAGIECQF